MSILILIPIAFLIALLFYKGFYHLKYCIAEYNPQLEIDEKRTNILIGMTLTILLAVFIYEGMPLITIIGCIIALVISLLCVIRDLR